jgi:hypothetical protein
VGSSPVYKQATIFDQKNLILLALRYWLQDDDSEKGHTERRRRKYQCMCFYASPNTFKRWMEVIL